MSPSACGAGGAARLAVKAYLDGEALCDHMEHTREGIRLMRRAMDAEPELDADEWPPWATKLKGGLEHARSHPPPLATADFEGPMDDASLDRLAAVYRERHFAIIDGFISPEACQLAHSEMAREDCSGGLEVSRVFQTVRNHAVSVAMPDRRSDRVAYLDLAHDEEGQWRTVSDIVEKIDAIASCLRSRVPEELGSLESRQRPMISAYGEGAKFERHCDNHCDDDDDDYDPELGHCANRRRLSAVLYCVPPTWSEAHGGALRLYRSTQDTGGWDGDDALLDVLPKPGRLILFASDQRVPHEVLPVTASDVVRYALALWFLGPGKVGELEADEAEARAEAEEAEGQQDKKERASETSVIAAL